jgi:hypothetical protein
LRLSCRERPFDCAKYAPLSSGGKLLTERAAGVGRGGRIECPIKRVVLCDFGLVFANKRGFEEQINLNTRDTKKEEKS